MPRWGFLASAEFRACIFPVQYPRVHVACSRAYTAHAKADRIWWNIKVAQRLCGLCGDGADAECMFHWLKKPTFEAFGLELCVEIVTLFQSRNRGEFTSRFDWACLHCLQHFHDARREIRVVFLESWPRLFTGWHSLFDLFSYCWYWVCIVCPDLFHLSTYQNKFQSAFFIEMATNCWISRLNS